MSNQILLNSSVLVSACDPKAKLHREALAFLRATSDNLRLPEVALNEVAYLLNRDAELGGVKFFIALIAMFSLPLQSVYNVELLP
jgi:predicted nucleic acid-binding protein